MRRAVILLGMWLLLGGGARAMDVAEAVRGGQWDAAAGLAATAPDPVAGKLVRFLRALTPGAASAADVLTVMAEAADWPEGGVLLRRYGEALTQETDDVAVAGLCRRRAPGSVAGLLRCADALARTGSDGAAMARLAWLSGITDAAGEVAFIKRWGAAIGPAEQRARFERLAWTDNGAAGGTLARQAVRLDATARPAAEVRLALKRGEPTGPGLFDALPAAAQAEPGLVLDLARWFRRADRDGDAVRVWSERASAAERAAPAERQPLFWEERQVLARTLLRQKFDGAAFQVAALPTAAAGSRSEAAFLAGWIALRRLQDPAAALVQFGTVATGSRSAITNGRAQYWLGRAQAASGHAADAAASYRAGAAWATTYYGQLAALALGEGAAGLGQRIRALADPAWDEEAALAFAGSELARAATLLVVWGQIGRVRPFLVRMAEHAGDPGGQALMATFALALGLPDAAVTAARLAGRDGVMLPAVGWPAAADPPPGPVERAVVLGVIRQESSFDATARSPSGALGLMQLMPATAAQVARRLGAAMTPLTQPGFNMRLGTEYLGAQIERFGSVPPALSAYNAGPSRTRDWLAAFGDPAAGATDPIDWVELIPFEETRNYVQRIVENIMIYRAHEGVELPHPVLGWAGSGT